MNRKLKFAVGSFLWIAAVVLAAVVVGGRVAAVLALGGIAGVVGSLAAAKIRSMISAKGGDVARNDRGAWAEAHDLALAAAVVVLLLLPVGLAAHAGVAVALAVAAEFAAVMAGGVLFGEALTMSA